MPRRRGVRHSLGWLVTPLLIAAVMLQGFWLARDRLGPPAHFHLSAATASGGVESTRRPEGSRAHAASGRGTHTADTAARSQGRDHGHDHGRVHRGHHPHRRPHPQASSASPAREHAHALVEKHHHDDDDDADVVEVADPASEKARLAASRSLDGLETVPSDCAAMPAADRSGGGLTLLCPDYLSRVSAPPDPPPRRVRAAV